MDILFGLIGNLIILAIPFFMFYSIFRHLKELHAYKVMVGNLCDKTVANYIKHLSKTVILNSSPSNWERLRQAWCIVNESPDVSTAVKTKLRDMYIIKGVRLTTRNVIDNQNTMTKY